MAGRLGRYPDRPEILHVTPDLEDVLERSPLDNSEPIGGYDGHSRTLKNCRLARYITGAY